MRLLLDTHILLQALADSPRLGPVWRQEIVSPRNEVFVSATSVWEISIKKRLGKLNAPDNILEFIEAADFAQLTITLAHAIAAGALPLHH
jgi:PIN domain nuclease of toxin-antitoxin system